MRRHAAPAPGRRVVTALAAGFVLAWPAMSVAATRPDVPAMTLASRDLPAGAHLVNEQRIHLGRGAYARTFSFSGRAAREAGMTEVFSATALFRHDYDAFFGYLGARESFAGRKGRRRLAAGFARRFHVAAADIRVSRPINQHLADGAFTTRVRVHRRRRTIGATVAWMLYGRVLAEVDVTGAPGAGRVVSRTHALLEAVRAHIRVVLLPALMARPVIVGTPELGAIVQATAGAWKDNSLPTSFRYQWQRCTADGTACASIHGATRPSYTVRERDAGFTLRVLVTAVDDIGRTTVGSAVTPAVGGAPPAKTAHLGGVHPETTTVVYHLRVG